MSEQHRITVELPLAVVERLNGLAESGGRSASVLAAHAISDFVDTQLRHAEKIAEAVQRADAGGPFVSHDRVAAWASSLGTDAALPKPKA